MNAVEHAPPPLRTRGGTLSGRVSTDLSDLVRYRHLVWYMAMSSLAIESRGTKLGRAWWVIEPIALVGVYALLVVALHVQVPNFPLVIGASVLAFEFYARSVGRSMLMLQTTQSSMLHVGFPRSVVPLAVTLSEAIRFAISLVAFIAIAAAAGILPTPGALLAIPFIVVEVLFTLGASYFFAASGIFFRDLIKITEYLFFVLFQLGCGIFPLSSVPQHPLWVKKVVLLDPFTTFFEGLRGPLLHGRAPEIPIAVIGGVTLFSILLFIGGYVYFLQREGSFSKVVV